MCSRGECIHGFMLKLFVVTEYQVIHIFPIDNQKLYLVAVPLMTDIQSTWIFLTSSEQESN